MNDIQFIKLVERIFIAAMACVVIGVAVYIVTLLYSFGQATKEQTVITPTPQSNKVLWPDQSNDRLPGDGPDIRYCLRPEIDDLWECIVDAEYSKYRKENDHE